MGGLMPPGVEASVGRIVLGPDEHPFPSLYAIWQRQLRIEPSIYLDAMMRDFLVFGGRLVIRGFDTPRDVTSLGENLIVNCTGLGSSTLFGDATMVPRSSDRFMITLKPAAGCV
jgi:hypothetical protein